jgi:hypothetical protein
MGAPLEEDVGKPYWQFKFGALFDLLVLAIMNWRGGRRTLWPGEPWRWPMEGTVTLKVQGIF